MLAAATRRPRLAMNPTALPEAARHPWPLLSRRTDRLLNQPALRWYQPRVRIETPQQRYLPMSDRQRTR